MMSSREGLRRTTRGIKREASPDVTEVSVEPGRKRRATDRRSISTKTKDDAPVLSEQPPTPVLERPAAVPLPTKIAADQPLPVLNQPQPTKLSNKDYQTIAESGILALSLDRSRHAWMHNAIFERFWSKAHYKRKKDAEAEGVKTPSGNLQSATTGTTFGHQKSGGVKPPMTKVGECKLIVDPHVFDITLYIVKDPNPPIQPQQSPGVYTKGIANQNFVQYPSPARRPASPVPKTPASTAPTAPPIRIQTYHPSSTVSTPVQSGGARSVSGQPDQAVPKSDTTASNVPKTSLNQSIPNPGLSSAAKSPSSVPQVQKPSPAASHPPSKADSSTSATKSLSTPRKTPSSAVATPAQPKPDPVIAILAERAQGNSQLKAIMQIVATGGANAEQLTYFQGHITEIQSIVERRKREEELRKRKEQETRNLAVGRSRATDEGKGDAKPQTHMTTPSQAKPLMTTSQNKMANGSSHPSSTNVMQSSSTKSKTVGSSTGQAPRFQAPSPLGTGASTPVSTHVSRVGQGQLTPSQQVASTPRSELQPAQPIRKPITAPLHVLIEFNQNSIDRFLFPAYSILQFSPDWKRCLCSFLVVRTSSRAADPSRYPTLEPARENPASKTSKGKAKGDAKGDTEDRNKEMEYYQPVTVTFNCDDASIMNYLAKVVKPRAEVLKYMKDVMRRAKRAENAYLPRRLPRKNARIDADVS